ncbi:MAG: TRAP transporter small permease [Bacillota bacterium]|nr:TRAP transporter small permease [Bacillota bacterium]
MSEESKTIILTEAEIKKELGMVRELKNTLFDRFFLNFMSIIFLIMIALVMSQVVVRYLTAPLGITMHWSEEVARYIMIVVAFMGSAVAWRKRENISISMLIDMLPPRIKVPLDLFKDITILAFSLFCAYGAYSMSVKMQYSPLGALKIGKLGDIYLVLCFVFLLVAVYLVRWIIRGIIETKELFFSKQGTEKEGVNT